MANVAPASTVITPCQEMRAMVVGGSFADRWGSHWMCGEQRPRQERGGEDDARRRLVPRIKTAVGKAMPHNKRTSLAVSVLDLFPRRSVSRTTHRRRKNDTDFRPTRPDDYRRVRKTLLRPGWENPLGIDVSSLLLAFSSLVLEMDGSRHVPNPATIATKQGAYYGRRSEKRHRTTRMS
jgi:hypothetical protein